MADERIPDEVLREPTIFDEHTGEWLGGWPDEGRAEDAIDRLKGELKACREALRDCHLAMSAVAKDGVERKAHKAMSKVKHALWAEITERAKDCLPGGGRRDGFKERFLDAWDANRDDVIEDDRKAHDE